MCDKFKILKYDCVKKKKKIYYSDEYYKNIIYSCNMLS